MGSRPYDGLTGNFLTMNWQGIKDDLMTPLSLRLYRFKNNDPVNRDPSMFQGPKELYEKIKAMQDLSAPLFHQKNLFDTFGFPFNVDSSSPLSSSSRTSLRNVLEESRRLTAVTPSVLSSQTLATPGGKVKIARTDSPLGKFVAFWSGGNDRSGH